MQPRRIYQNQVIQVRHSLLFEFILEFTHFPYVEHVCSNVVEVVFGRIYVSGVDCGLVGVQSDDSGLLERLLAQEGKHSTPTSNVQDVLNAFIPLHLFERIYEIDEIFLVGRHPYLAFRIDRHTAQTGNLDTFLDVFLSCPSLEPVLVGLEKHVMFVLVLNSSYEGEFIPDFGLDLPVHVEELLRQFAVPKRLLK